jgi:hypothetical protein
MTKIGLPSFDLNPDSPKADDKMPFDESMQRAASTESHKFTTSVLSRFDSLKTENNELYDLSVPKTKQIYDKAVRIQRAAATSRDTTSFVEIETNVRAASVKYKGDGIVILDGAYPHMIGAIRDLQKDFNIYYIPIKDAQISTETYDQFSQSKRVTVKNLEVQIRRDIGVTKYLGFDTMEAIRKAIDSEPFSFSKPTLVIIASNETGLHHLKPYYDADTNAYEGLEKIIGKMRDKPAFIQYIGEDLSAGSLRKDVMKLIPEKLPRNAFLQKMYKTGIPVEIGAFGEVERGY